MLPERKPDVAEKLLPQAQLGDADTIPFDVGLFQVSQQVAAVTNHLQQTPAGVVVMGMHLEVLLQIVDALGENSDLHFGRTGVGFMEPVGGNDFVLFFFS